MNSTSSGDMPEFEDSLLLGTFFLLLSASFSFKELSSLKTLKPKLLTSFPVDGLFIMTLSSVSIIGTVTIASHKTDSDTILSMITIFIAFSIPGLLKIVWFYFPAIIISDDTENFSITIGFLLEFLTFYKGKCSQLSDASGGLKVLSFICLVISSLTMMSTKVILNQSLMTFTSVQATWLFHYTFAPTTLSRLHLSWHILACLLMTTFGRILLINNLYPKTTETHVHDNVSDTNSDTNTRQTLVSISDSESDGDDAKVYKDYEIK